MARFAEVAYLSDRLGILTDACLHCDLRVSRVSQTPSSTHVIFQMHSFSHT